MKEIILNNTETSLYIMSVMLSILCLYVDKSIDTIGVFVGLLWICFFPMLNSIFVLCSFVRFLFIFISLKISEMISRDEAIKIIKEIKISWGKFMKHKLPKPKFLK